LVNKCNKVINKKINRKNIKKKDNNIKDMENILNIQINNIIKEPSNFSYLENYQKEILKNN
jgi:hypothetical protein